jgi:hypothetical integral membrane protein (TIGR02206 family)
LEHNGFLCIIPLHDKQEYDHGKWKGIFAMQFFSFAPMSESNPGYLAPFSPVHLITLGFFALLGGLIVIFKKKLRDEKRGKVTLLIATVVALVFEASYHLIQYLTLDYYEFLRHLIPFELCAITLWLSVALCISKNKTVFELLYFWGIGALASLLFADDDGAGPDRWRFYQYFGTHGYIVLTIVFFAAVHSFSIKLKSLVKAIVILVPISIGMRFFDLAFSGPPYKFNFMFLVSPPDISTPLDSFGHGWGYYFAFVAIGLALMFVAYLPWPIAHLFRRIRVDLD